MLTVATYNVNSIRARLDRVLAWSRRCREAYVFQDERKSKQPSDHAAVVPALAGD